ncbi:hypothetical protein C0992_009061 [Termitomyces sp. T32_za158]|nr:hypothetical protein C0992_009061 [Termitomyces sp. T32_za158]
MAILEPGMIMPELLERAYGGLEIVNETHRTTAVLNMLAGVALPLVSESTWSGGQRHLVPLLELCIPGIDLVCIDPLTVRVWSAQYYSQNDPSKTMCTTMFIVSVVQHIKLGDLTKFTSGISYSSNDANVIMENDFDIRQDADTDVPSLSKEESRSIVRETTASFAGEADWVTSLVRRILALYENLPEEGGRRNTTGGKQEEGVLKSIKAMMDVVCLHLSDELFNLVLNLLYDYATTNAKSNAVTAFGQLIACMARVKPEETMAKFLPYCISQIEEEIKHGASSVRTTSSHAAIPSDTTLHWNLSILRGCLGFGGTVLLNYKQQILSLFMLLVDKTKSERGYTSTGRLITRTLHTLAETYPTNSRFVNSDVWVDPAFNKDHNIHWGRLYNPEDVAIQWHVPNNDEINFVFEILDHVFLPATNKVESLLNNTSRWDNVDRNDFCRYLAVWGGLSTFFKEQPKEVINPCLNEVELAEMVVVPLDVNAGFTLEDASDHRYQKAAAYRLRYGDICQRAAFALRQKIGSEDHIDAVIGVTRAIDTFMLGYGLNRSDFDSLQKNYDQARDANRFWIKQRENSRLVFLKRAQVYHSGRVYMHSLYRRRSALDDRLLEELVELSLSPYTRVRRQAQNVLNNVCGYYVRSTRFILPSIFDALGKGSDPDRIKGALYLLWNKGTAVVKVLTLIKFRSYSKSREELWLDEWRNPLAQDVEITNSENFMLGFDESLDFTGGLYVDKIRTGFLAWTSTIKAYRAVEASSGIEFEPESQACLTVIRDIIMNSDYYAKLFLLWMQESGKSGGTIELRKENILFIKSLGNAQARKYLAEYCVVRVEVTHHTERSQSILRFQALAEIIAE